MGYIRPSGADLCADGKVVGVVKNGKSYQIPLNAQKPADGRYRDGRSASAYSKRWLKWNDDVVGVITSDGGVAFTSLEYNEVVGLYTRGRSSWTLEQFAGFLSERIVSRDRRDIERILFRCGLSHYDVMQIAEITRGIHPKDLLWIAYSKTRSWKM